ncbi:hypothetical protein BGZ91_012061 [Linnemannia elongata]|nr:hypothetical protein BGZ91_012061 [Linnemannia elongata]
MVKTSISSLPPEIIDYIASHLINPTDLNSCSLLNNYMYRIFTPHLWKTIHFCHRGQDNADYYLAFYDRHRVKWFSRLEQSIKAGSLDRNGHWVQSIRSGYFDTVKLLASHGHNLTGLQELKLGSDPCMTTNPFGRLRKTLDLELLVTVLRRCTSLQSLKLVGRLLNETKPGWLKVLGSIPVSVENLELEDWCPAGSARWISEPLNNSLGPYRNEVVETTTQPPPPTLFRLKRLALISYSAHVSQKTTHFLLSNSPNLETIYLSSSNQRGSLQLISSLLASHCPRVKHLHLLEWDNSSDAELADLLQSSKAGWRTVDMPRPSTGSRQEFGKLSTVALLKHASTLESICLAGCWTLPSSAVQALLSSAPNLKRFDAITDSVSGGSRDLTLDAIDIIAGDDWVCTSLESLQVQIGGIPRPDVHIRHDGQPFTSTLNFEGTIEDSRSIQRLVYTQLGRLTQLKQLVLGREVFKRQTALAAGLDSGDGGGEESSGDDGGGVEYHHGFQYECLEMNLASGMGLMAELKELRRMEVGAMATTKWENKDLEWICEHWPKLDPKNKF